MPPASTRKPVPSATSAVASGAPGNIAAGPALTGVAAWIATTPCFAPAIRSTNEPGADGYKMRVVVAAAPADTGPTLDGRASGGSSRSRQLASSAQSDAATGSSARV